MADKPLCLWAELTADRKQDLSSLPWGIQDVQLLAPAGVVYTLSFAQGSLKVCGIQTDHRLPRPLSLVYAQRPECPGKVTNAAHLKLAESHAL